LFSLFDAADHLVDTISNLGPRTLRIYTDWTKALKETNIPVEINWRSPVIGKSSISFNPNKASRILDVLSDISETEEEMVEVVGELVGANVRTRVFEFKTNDNEKITGRIAKDAIRESSIILGSQCKVNLIKVTTTYVTTGQEKISWTLKGIQQMDEL
jgi:hypothetical protein